MDPGILAAIVTRFVLDQLGTRQAVALYVQGVKQQVPYVGDDRVIHANGANWTVRDCLCASQGLARLEIELLG